MKLAQSRCRLCFDKHTEMLDIFDEYGCRKSVREKITSRLHIFVSLNLLSIISYNIMNIV